MLNDSPAAAVRPSVSGPRGASHFYNPSHPADNFRPCLSCRRRAPRFWAVHSVPPAARSLEDMSVLLRSVLVITSVVALTARSQAETTLSASDFVVREWHGED